MKSPETGCDIVTGVVSYEELPGNSSPEQALPLAPARRGRLQRRGALKSIAALILSATGGAGAATGVAEFERSHPSPTDRVSPLVRDTPNSSFTEIRWRGECIGRDVALTFDDGPDRRWTPRVLDILAKHSVRATFFMLGSHVAQLPAIAASVVKAGHEVGSHNWDHSHMTVRTADELHTSLQRTHTQIFGATGKAPTLMRPPYGQFDGEVAWSVSRMGYSITLWSHRMTADNPWARARENIKTAVPGMIMLSHDGRSTPSVEQMEALDWMIGEMIKQNWHFTTVSKLLSK